MYIRVSAPLNGPTFFPSPQNIHEHSMSDLSVGLHDDFLAIRS